MSARATSVKLNLQYTGHHEGGPLNPNWVAAAHRADALLREIAATLDPSKDTLLVTSDHGHIDRGGHGGPEPVLLVQPFVLAGPGVPPGAYGDINQVDTAPTAVAIVGVPALAGRSWGPSERCRT